MTTRATLLLPLVVGLLATGCGGAESASQPAGAATPEMGELIVSSVDAVTALKDPKLHYDVSASLDADPSAQASAQTKMLLSAPVTMKASGGLSAKSVTLDAQAALSGKTYRAQALVGPTETYIKLMGVWYGDRKEGLNDAAEKAGAPADRAEFEKALAKLKTNADKLLTGEVSAGPDLEGETWQVRGACNADGIVAFAASNGQTVSASDRDELRAFCRVAEITYVVGADDRLPRRLHVTADIDKAELAKLASGGSSANELDGVKAEFDVTMSRWGKDVTFDAPSSSRPLEELGQALVGMFMSANNG